MKKLLDFLERKMLPSFEKISKQRHLQAIREGVISVFPIIIIGIIFLFISSIPFPETWGIKNFLITHESLLLAPYQVTTFIVTLYLVVAIGASLAKYYNYNSLTGSLIAIVTFLMTIVPVDPASLIPPEILEYATTTGLDMSWLANLKLLGWILPAKNLGATGAFLGALSAIVGVESIHLCTYIYKKTKTPIKVFNIEIPSSIIELIKNVFPFVLIVLFMFLIRDVLGINLQEIISSLFSTLIHTSNNFLGAIIFVAFLSFFSFIGVNGLNINGATNGLWMSILIANQLAHTSGEALPNVAPLPFFQWFVWIGGIGSSLSLVLLFCFSKSNKLKKIGQACFISSIININDPIFYGTPIILNPFFLIPFILGPVVTTAFSYLVISLGFVGKVYAQPLINLPSPIGAFLATGDWKAILLCLVNILICMVIYYPFFKMYESKILNDTNRTRDKVS